MQANQSHKTVVKNNYLCALRAELVAMESSLFNTFDSLLGVVAADIGCRSSNIHCKSYAVDGGIGQHKDGGGFVNKPCLRIKLNASDPDMIVRFTGIGPQQGQFFDLVLKSGQVYIMDGDLADGTWDILHGVPPAAAPSLSLIGGIIRAYGTTTTPSFADTKASFKLRVSSSSIPPLTYTEKVIEKSHWSGTTGAGQIHQ